MGERPPHLKPPAYLTPSPPVPEPAFVIVPVLLTAVVESVIPAAVALSLSSTRLPVPLTPPDTVNSFVPAVLVSSPETVPLARLLKVAALLTAPVRSRV